MLEAQGVESDRGPAARRWLPDTAAWRRRRLRQGISGPIVDINAALDPEIDAVITGHTHLPYNCRRLRRQAAIVTSAYSFGRVVSEIDLVLDKRTGDVRRDLSTAENHAVIRADLKPDPP